VNTIAHQPAKVNCVILTLTVNNCFPVLTSSTMQMKKQQANCLKLIAQLRPKGRVPRASDHPSKAPGMHKQKKKPF